MYERERRSGRFPGDLGAFQRQRGGMRVHLLRATRDAALRRAVRVLTPSGYLRELVLSWGIPPGRVAVSPNPAPAAPLLPAREGLRHELAIDGPTLAFAGRLMAAKALDVALRALERTPGVTLLVVGDGPDRAELERLSSALGLDGRVRFLGGRSRDDVLGILSAVDAALLSSRWENFPHSAVEASSCNGKLFHITSSATPSLSRSTRSQGNDGEPSCRCNVRRATTGRRNHQALARDKAWDYEIPGRFPMPHTPGAPLDWHANGEQMPVRRATLRHGRQCDT